LQVQRSPQSDARRAAVRGEAFLMVVHVVEGKGMAAADCNTLT